MDEADRSARLTGIACIALGVLLALVSGLAETFGIGGGTFGWKQVAGVVVGCLIALVGVFIVWRLSSRAPNAE